MQPTYCMTAKSPAIIIMVIDADNYYYLPSHVIGFKILSMNALRLNNFE